MIRLEVDDTVALDIIDAYIEAANKAPGLVNTLIKRRVSRTKSQLLKKLRTYPNAVPDLPFIWSHDPVKQARARRWYFANKVPRGSSGGRYQRTGQMGKAWDAKLTVNEGGGELLVTNNTPGVEYVQGERQVPSHKITGWPTVDDAVLDVIDILEDGLINDWFVAVDPYAGVKP